ncbi:hypothetical protein D3C86_1865060 [compost metagenome]
MQFVHELIEADRACLGWNHHHADNEGKEWLTQLPVIGHKPIGGQGREIDRAEGCKTGDNQ